MVEKVDPQKGLAFVMHGLGGLKEAAHLQAMSEAFLDNGYTVVRFDTTNSLGESDGDYQNATTTNYYQDLEDVIAWASKKAWYQEPFILAGHSLGGISVAWFAENHPEKVKALAPISTVVSGQLSLEALRKYRPDDLKQWEKTGWREEKSLSKPGVIKRLNWTKHIADRLKYDLLPKAKKLTMPVLLIVGSEDRTTVNQEVFFMALPGKKELHVIKGAPHTFRETEHIKEIKRLFDEWIKKL